MDHRGALPLRTAALFLLGYSSGLTALGGPFISVTDQLLAATQTPLPPAPFPTSSLARLTWIFKPGLFPWSSPCYTHAPGISVAEVVRVTHIATKNGSAFAVPVRPLAQVKSRSEVWLE